MQARAWIDGGSRGNPGPAGWGVHLLRGNGASPCDAWGFLGETTNNVAEYQGLIAALRLALEMDVRRIELFTDSQLIQRQVTGVYRVKQAHLRELFDEVKMLARRFAHFEIHHVPRAENKQADALANRAMDERGSGRKGPC